MKKEINILEIVNAFHLTNNEKIELAASIIRQVAYDNDDEILSYIIENLIVNHIK